MKYFVIFLVLIGLSGVAFAQYQGGVDFYHLTLTVESKQYSVLTQSNTNHFTGVVYDHEANSLIFSTSVSEDFIDTYTITMNEQTFSELFETDYAKTPDSMLVLINGVEQPYKTVEDDEIISWQFYAPPSSNEIEIIPSTSMLGTGTYEFDKIPKGSSKIYPPLKQNHIGIVTENIQCKDDLVLLQKHNGLPACVKPASVIDLIKRNWMVTEDVGGYAIDYDGDVEHLPFADICSNEMKILLLAHSNIASIDEEFVMENVRLPSRMNQEDFDRCAQETSFTKSRWNMITVENPEPSSEPKPENKELQEHYEIEIIGLKDKYEIGEKYSFYFIISGYGYSCANYDAKYPDENGNTIATGSEVLCASQQHKTEFEINQAERKGTLGNIGIQTPGTYTVTVTFEKPNPYLPTSVSKTFEVME